MKNFLYLFIIPFIALGGLGFKYKPEVSGLLENASTEAGDPFLIDAVRGINVRKKPNAKRIGAIPHGHTVFATGPAQLHRTGRAGKQYWLPIRYQNESNEWVQGWIYMRYATSAETDQRQATIVKSIESGTDGTENALHQDPAPNTEAVEASQTSMRLNVNVMTRARLRASPSFSGRILDRLKSDVEVEIIGRPAGQWIPVRVLATGQKGWMHVSLLETEGRLNPLELADRHGESSEDAKKEIDEYAESVQTEAEAPGVCTSCQDQAQLQELPLGNSGYRYPVNAAIRSRFGMRKDPFTGKESRHGGVDFAVRTGTSVGAIRGGKVVQVKNSCQVGQKRCGGGWGNHVIIDHGNGVRSVYAHLKNVNVQVGSQVAAGTVIGRSGSTGRSTGPHLHLEMHVNGAKVDPLKYISK